MVMTENPTIRKAATMIIDSHKLNLICVETFLFCFISFTRYYKICPQGALPREMYIRKSLLLLITILKACECIELL